MPAVVRGAEGRGRAAGLMALPLLDLFGFDPKGGDGPAEPQALTALHCLVPIGLWLLWLVPI